jgi:predicted DsbA family dithiol-disulfide isomerase
MTKPTIKIDVVSDVVCPWCYIGKRRLEKAMTVLSDEYNFEVEYHPFELNPDMPVAGRNQKEYLAQKFGGEDRYNQITGHTTQTAAGEGLDFHFERQLKSPNTRKAHALVQLAKVKGKSLTVIESLFKAYFTDGVDLTNDTNLVAIAVEAGLERQEVEGFLADEAAVKHVALQEQEVQKLGISGVPFYIINSKYGVSGAQASETFMNAFRQISQESVASPSGEACEVNGQDC